MSRVIIICDRRVSARASEMDQQLMLYGLETVALAKRQGADM